MMVIPYQTVVVHTSSSNWGGYNYTNKICPSTHRDYLWMNVENWCPHQLAQKSVAFVVIQQAERVIINFINRVMEQLLNIWKISGIIICVLHGNSSPTYSKKLQQFFFLFFNGFNFGNQTQDTSSVNDKWSLLYTLPHYFIFRFPYFFSNLSLILQHILCLHGFSFCHGMLIQT